MASEYIDYSIITTAADTDAYVIAAAYDTLYVGQFGNILAFGLGSSGVVVPAAAPSAQVIVDGAVYGNEAGIETDGEFCNIIVNGRVSSLTRGIDAGDITFITVGPTGFVTGGNAIVLPGGAVDNAGTISGTLALQLLGETNSIRNTGLINGDIFIDADDTFITNSGTIRGSTLIQPDDFSEGLTVDNAGLWAGDIRFTVDADRLTNTGSISGNASLHAGDDIVQNFGSIVFVDLGDGADVLDNRRGAVTSAIFGGLGADSVFSGEGADTIYADNPSTVGGGNDLIRAGGGDDVVLGDIGSDNLRGDDGDDELLGEDQADLLTGGRGDDLLEGGKGVDQLRGGVGDDVLTGGDQGDTFVFRPGFGHDIITDFFAESGGKHDVIQFSRALFGTFGGIQAKMNQVGADVVIKVSNEDTLVLQNVDLADMTADDFGFVS